MSYPFADFDQHIAAFLRGGDFDGSLGGDGGFGFEDGAEDAAGFVVCEEDYADGVVQVWGDGDHGMGGLDDVVDVKFLDEGGLDGGSAGGEFRGVDGGGEG